MIDILQWVLCFVLTFIKNCLVFCTIMSPDFYNAVAKHRFTLCPWGNGLDTHRLYEGGCSSAT